MNGDNHLLGIFARHKVAPNLLMAIMLLAGLLSLTRLNTQFFPNFELDMITVSVVWSGASAEDVEQAITIPLEQRLRLVDNLKQMSSSSAAGTSGVTLEFEDGADMTLAMEQVRKQVDSFTALPPDAESPRISQLVRYESVARLLVSGLADGQDLRYWVRRFEQQLLERGIDKVDIEGLPEESLIIELPSLKLLELGMGLPQVAERLRANSQDIPAGLSGRADGTREVRSLEQRRSPGELAGLPLLEAPGAHLTLGDVARIERRIPEGAETLSLDGERAAVLVLRRSEQGDSLESARILQDWLDEVRPTLPPTLRVEVFSERWQLIKQRILLLLENGASGLLLVLIILYLFLSPRVAFWVAVGIPVSFMATLAVMYLSGESINMISLFALIMALGIIVDDAIVVGEDAQAHFDMGEDPLTASEGGARRMLAPVLASSLTTIAAFLPLLLVGGRMGNIMSAIPMVIIAVIIASLIESFFILPGHLRHAFVHAHRGHKTALRRRLDDGFAHFRDRLFRPLARLALVYRGLTLALAAAMLILAVGLVVSGKVGWRFFPSPESTTIYANIRFVAGTGSDKVDRFLEHLEQALEQTIEDLDEQVVDTWYVRHASTTGQGRAIRGERNGSIYVELVDSDQRRMRNREFMEQWKQRVVLPDAVESFTLTSRRVGPSHKDLTVRLYGSDARAMKLGALSLEAALKDMPGVSAIDDDLPYGYEQRVFALSADGEAAGLSLEDLGQQLRAALNGIILQRFQQGADEVDVVLQLPRSETDYLMNLDALPIRLPDGGFAPLGSLVSWRSQQGFENLRHADGRLAVEVTADVDEAVNSVAAIQKELRRNLLPELASRYGVETSLEGGAARERETLSDMKLGVYVALGLIYLVLAWVFSSYGWPLLVMMTIPLGLTGAIFGHGIMGMPMTLLSLFGFFALSGIVVNDSIILVSFYRHLRQQGIAVHEALVEAACQRLRAVLLTSLTTIAGLTPLLFETSRQAQFLIPMVVSIAFGLAYATLLILFVIPALLSIYEDSRLWLQARMGGNPPAADATRG